MKIINRIYRPLLWPILGLIEIFLWVIAWTAAMIHLPTAEKIVELACKLPDPEWYWPDN